MRVRFGECVLDSDTRQLSVRGETVHLSPSSRPYAVTSDRLCDDFVDRRGLRAAPRNLSRVRPSLLDQKRQVVYPIASTDPARIDHVGQIVFRVRENKIGVRNCIVHFGEPGFPGRRSPRRLLGCFDGGFGSRQTNKAIVKLIEPAAQHRGNVTCGIGGHKNKLDLIRDTGWDFLRRRSNIRHVHRTLIGAIRVPKKEERDGPLRSLPEIERSAGGVSEDKSRFRQGRRDHATPVRCLQAIGGRRAWFRFSPRRDRRLIN
jgi:hypothetical protein